MHASRQTCQEALLSQNKDRFKKMKNKEGEGDAINQDCSSCTDSLTVFGLLCAGCRDIVIDPVLLSRPEQRA